MQITTEFLKSLNPCKDRWENYLKYHEDFKGSLSEFMELDHISAEDKIWVFCQKIPKLEDLQREFALICASRAVEETDCEKLKEFFTLQILIVQNGFWYLKDSEEHWDAYWAADRAAYRAADRAADWAAERAAERDAYRAADWAADWAAYRAAERAAERKVQLEVIKNLLGEK